MEYETKSLSIAEHSLHTPRHGKILAAVKREYMHKYTRAHSKVLYWLKYIFVCYTSAFRRITSEHLPHVMLQQ